MGACIRCGAEIPDDAIYCQRCEHLVGTTASMPSPSSSPNVRPKGATDLEPQTRQRRRQRSFLASLLLLLGVRRNPRTGSPGCAFWPTLSVALTAALIIGFITGPVLKLFPPFSPISPSIQVTFGSAGSVNVHGANFPARSRIHLILDGVGITFPPTTSHPSISQSLYNISFYVDQVNTIQQIKQPSFANSIIVRDDGTFDAQIDIPKNWQPDSQHVIEAQAVGQDGRAQTQVQRTVTMPAESSGVALSAPTPTSTPTPTHTVAPTSVPVVSKINPAGGLPNGGTTVTIDGSGFTDAKGVSFGSTAATNVNVVSDSQITAVSPAGSGMVDVMVVTPNGTSQTSNADQFIYTASPPPAQPPVVSSLDQKSGPAAGGATVTITGSGFTKAISVSFGLAPVSCGVDNTCTVDSDTHITVVTPAENPSDASAAVPVDVTVTTPNGTSTKSSADQFTYIPPSPTVSSVDPSGGLSSGGTSVTINGTDFTGATSVAFGSAAIQCSSGDTCTINNDGTQMTVTSPAESSSDAIGPVDVTVTTAGGTSPKNSADQFTYANPPADPSADPSADPPVGSPVIQ